MKKCWYILFSVFLSLLVIYMEVGILVVQYQCTKCADTTLETTPLLVVIKTSEGGCKCGCAEAEGTGCSDKGACCCGAPKAADQTASADGMGQTGTDDNSCSTVHVEKLNLPTLTDSLRVTPPVVFPMTGLFFYSSLINNVPHMLADAEHRQRCMTDHSMHGQQRMRGYLNFICTLVI